jgi:hypothetical protein
MRSFNNEVSVYLIETQTITGQWVLYYTASGLLGANDIARTLRSCGHNTRIRKVA